MHSQKRRFFKQKGEWRNDLKVQQNDLMTKSYTKYHKQLYKISNFQISLQVFRCMRKWERRGSENCNERGADTINFQNLSFIIARVFVPIHNNAISVHFSLCSHNPWSNVIRLPMLPRGAEWLEKSNITNRRYRMYERQQLQHLAV